MKGLKEYFRLRDIYRIQAQINSNKEIFKYNNKATRFITPYSLYHPIGSGTGNCSICDIPLSSNVTGLYATYH